MQSTPYTFKNRYTLLTCKLQQVGINRDGQPLTRTLLRLYGGQKKPARKNPFGEKTWQEILVRTMPQTQSSWQPVLRGFTVKENMLSMPRRYSTPQNFERFHRYAQRRFHISNSGFASSRWQHHKRFLPCSRVGGIVVSIAAFQAVDPASIPGRRNEANSTVFKMLYERLTNLFLLVYYYFYWLFLMI